MHILIMTDIEGVAGVVKPLVDTTGGNVNYPRNCRLLTEEVNAAVRGFMQAGASAVTVWDGHGCGAIDFETLQPPARLIHGGPTPPLVWLFSRLAGRFNAIAHVGQHAMAGERSGNLNHTQSSAEIISYTLNGREIGEIAQFALLAGSFGLPYIFLAGDQAACREAEELQPGIVTAAVKEGLGRASALTLTCIEARALIEQQAGLALRQHLQHPLPPVRWPGPYILRKSFFHTEVTDMYLGDANARVLDSHTVELRGESIPEIIYK